MGVCAWVSASVSLSVSVCAYRQENQQTDK